MIAAVMIPIDVAATATWKYPISEEIQIFIFIDWNKKIKEYNSKKLTSSSKAKGGITLIHHCRLEENSTAGTKEGSEFGLLKKIPPNLSSSTSSPKDDPLNDPSIEEGGVHYIQLW